MTAFIVALNGLMAAIMHLRFTKLKKQVNGVFDEAIRAHRADAYRLGLEAGRRDLDRTWKGGE